MPAMAVDIETLPAKALPTGYEWQRIDSKQAGENWTHALALGYDLPHKVASLFSLNSISPEDPRVQTFSVTKGDQTVATSLLFLKDGLAGIYCISTLPEERRKGIAAFATVRALKNALGLGYKVGVLQSSAAGHNMYSSIGFKDVGSVKTFFRAATEESQTPAFLKQTDGSKAPNA